ncbi:hypothetical protein ACHWQZ_G014617 [Mnemiopsis leidyi]
MSSGYRNQQQQQSNHYYEISCPVPRDHVHERNMRGRRVNGSRQQARSVRDNHFRTSEIVKLNVGGRLFTTSRTTLIWINDTFFTGLLSNRIPSVLDENGAFFIDRDPDLFSVILNFLRTKNVNMDGVNMTALLHEAEYFGITPLIRRIAVCASLDKCSCGDLLFHALLPPPPQLTSRDNSPVVMRRRGRESLRLQVQHVIGSHNFIAVAYTNALSCYKLGEFSEWRSIFTTKLEYQVDLMAFNSRVPVSGPNSKEVLIAVSSGSHIHLWNVSDQCEVANYDLEVHVETLLFIASGLVALSSSGLIGVWNTMTQSWKVQQVQPVTSFDVAGCMLFIGCADGCIYCVDMAKFPLRMKDNDLLVSKLYCDPERNKGISITAISVYLTPKQCVGQQCGEWIEIAYGTNRGMVRIIFQHPETVGQGPQVLQTFNVHREAVTRVMLSENHLISVCSESNHVRSWTVTRFRGRILTQPSSTPLASFNVIELDEPYSAMSSNGVGPYGDKDDWAVFMQKVVQSSNEMFVSVASTGKRLCSLRSVDGTNITSYSLHECDSSTRTRMRRYILTGHDDGSIQMWDLTTAFDRAPKELYSTDSSIGQTGVTQEELLRLMNHCDLQASLSTSSASISPFSSSLSITDHSDEDNSLQGPPHHEYEKVRIRKGRNSLPVDIGLAFPSTSRIHRSPSLQHTSPSTTPVNSDDEGARNFTRNFHRKANTLPRRRPT